MNYNIEDDEDIEMISPEPRGEKRAYAETQAKRVTKTKKKRSPFRNALMLIFYATAVIALIALGTALYVWVEERTAREVPDDEVVTAAERTTGSAQMYTSAQVEAMLAEVRKEDEEAIEAAREEGRQSVLSSIKESLLDGNAFVEALRPLYKGEILLVSNGAFHFVPISEVLEKNDYAQEYLVIDEDTGRYSYEDADGNVVKSAGEVLMAAAEKMASTIAKNAPIAVRNCKKAIGEGLDADMDEALVIEEKLFGDCFETEDQKCGMAFFLDKNKEKVIEEISK